MVLLGDQPFIETGTIDLLLSRFWESKKDIVVPVCGERRGHPVVFARRFYDILNHIEGDIGAREVIATHRKDVLEVAVPDSILFADIDTWTNLNALKTIDP
jgi:molybdenum cofactor cytidylyltransferase